MRKRRGSCSHAAPENGPTPHSQSPGMGTWLLTSDLRAGWRLHLKPVGCPRAGRIGQLCSAAQEGKEEILGRCKQRCRQNWLGWTMTNVQQLHSRLSNAFSPKEGTLPGERETCPSVLPALISSAGFPVAPSLSHRDPSFPCLKRWDSAQLCSYKFASRGMLLPPPARCLPKPDPRSPAVSRSV